MTVLCENSSGCLLSHQIYLNELYKDCIGLDCGNSSERLKIKDEFFQINTPLLMDSAAAKIAAVSSGEVKHTKRRKVSSKKKFQIENHDQVMTVVEEAAKSIIVEGRHTGHINDGLVSAAEWMENNILAREAAKAVLAKNRIPRELKFSDTIWFKNANDKSIIKAILQEKYVLPPKCSFLLADIKYFGLMMDETYDLLVLDPPWPNKSVKRKQEYSMVNCSDLLNLPIQLVVHPGSYVIIWATNNESQLRFIKEELFPSWNVRHCADWQWLKITRKGDFFIQSQGETSKKPYENLIIGQVPGAKDLDFRQIESQKLIVSVPSSIHSHKPPLIEVLKPYLPPNPKCLELFARYLLPGWTSIGNEVLKLQQLDLYERY